MNVPLPSFLGYSHPALTSLCHLGFYLLLDNPWIAAKLDRVATMAVLCVLMW